MKVSKSFVKLFLALFLAVLIANIVTPFLGTWNYSLGGLLILFIVFFILLYLRKADTRLVKYSLLIIGGILLAIFLVLAVFFTISFLSEGSKQYVYDIGGEIDSTNPYLYPTDRISNISSANSKNTTYRNITSYLVYFDVPATKKGIINISLSILNNLPYGSVISIRGKNSTTWTYVENFAYVTINKPTNASWKTASVSFNAEDLLIEDGKFSFAIESSHMTNAITKKDYVSIDWINISESK